MKATLPLQHQCLFVNEQDSGKVTISWRTRDCTLELHSLREYLETFTNIVISHEELMSVLHSALSMFVEDVRVTSVWETAGGRIEVTR